MGKKMLGLTMVQARQLQEMAWKLWGILDQDDFYEISKIFENALNRFEQMESEEESD